MTRNPATQRYNRRIMSLSLCYAAALIGAEYGFKTYSLPAPLAYLVATLPAMAIIGMFMAIGRYLIEQQDEYLKVLEVRQTLWASGFALSAATIWGFLESFGLVPHVESYFVAVLWFGGLGLGALANKLTIGSLA